jgi:hypothetical protein
LHPSFILPNAQSKYVNTVRKRTAPFSSARLHSIAVESFDFSLFRLSASVDIFFAASPHWHKEKVFSRADDLVERV